MAHDHRMKPVGEPFLTTRSGTKQMRVGPYGRTVDVTTYPKAFDPTDGEGMWDDDEIES